MISTRMYWFDECLEFRIAWMTIWLSIKMTHFSREVSTAWASSIIWRTSIKFLSFVAYIVDVLNLFMYWVRFVQILLIESEDVIAVASTWSSISLSSMYMRIVADSMMLCFSMTSSTNSFMQTVDDDHHDDTTCDWRFSSRSSCSLNLSFKMFENRSRELCASRFRCDLSLFSSIVIMSSCSDEILIRNVISSAVCSSCCCTESRCAFTFTATLAIVRNAFVMICVARLWIFLMTLIILLSRLMYSVSEMCHAKQSYIIWDMIIALYIYLFIHRLSQLLSDCYAAYNYRYRYFYTSLENRAILATIVSRSNRLFSARIAFFSLELSLLIVFLIVLRLWLVRSFLILLNF